MIVRRPLRSLEVLEEERAVPWGLPELFAWHSARYAVARALARGRRVLDVGCGEGYGAAALAEVAEDVLGVDYSPAAVRHAGATYTRPNLTYRVLDAADLGSLEERFDLITCFEVIEHLPDDDAFLRAARELLRPEGCLILSTPNDLLWRAPRHAEDYHVNNLTPRLLEERLRKHFAAVELYGQVVASRRLHRTLKWLDFPNLRHRLVKAAPVKHMLAAAVGGPASAADTAPGDWTFSFSRRLVRQSQHLVAVAAATRAALPRLPQHGGEAP